MMKKNLKYAEEAVTFVHAKQQTSDKLFHVVDLSQVLRIIGSKQSTFGHVK